MKTKIPVEWKSTIHPQIIFFEIRTESTGKSLHPKGFWAWFKKQKKVKLNLNSATAFSQSYAKR